MNFSLGGGYIVHDLQRLPVHPEVSAEAGPDADLHLQIRERDHALPNHLHL